MALGETAVRHSRPLGVILFLVWGLAAWLGGACSADSSDASRTRAIGHYNRGVDLLAEGKTTLAEQQFKLALEADPDLSEAHLNLGLIYMHAGWLDGAEQSTLTGLRLLDASRTTIVLGSTLDQSKSLAYVNLGSIEFQRGILAELELDYDAAKSHWERGMNALRRAVDLDPNNAAAQALLVQFAGAY